MGNQNQLLTFLAKLNLLYGVDGYSFILSLTV